MSQEKLNIQELYVFVGKNDKGEGLVRYPLKPGQAPELLIGFSLKWAVAVKPLVNHIAKEQNLDIKCVCFTRRVDVGEVF